MSRLNRFMCLLSAMLLSSTWLSAVEAAPDLVPVGLTTPDFALPPVGTSIWIAWTVVNRGTSQASGSWTDRLYLSPTPTCCADATLLEEQMGPTEVAPGFGYSQLVPVGLGGASPGQHYLVLVIDALETLAESNEGNNQLAVPITIPPLTDLTITSLTAPASASTQQSVSVSWTIQDYPTLLGSAPATAPAWQDDLYFSRDATCCAGATHLGSFVHTGGLPVNGTYSQSATFTVPDVPAGTYYVAVWTDSTNAQPEWSDNNRRSVPINITTPDLVPTTLTGPSSAASTQQTITVTWAVQNQGKGPAIVPWQDNVYISPSPTCCVGAMLLGSWAQTATLAPGIKYKQAKTVSVPGVVPGKYYLIVWTNPSGSLHEERDDNNQKAIPLMVTAPDLAVTALTAPGSAAAGQAIAVSWTVQDSGVGPASGTWTDRLYIASTPACCTDATLLGQWDRSSLSTGASYTLKKTVTLPDVPAGSYYLIVHSDAMSTIYETSEANNQRAIPLEITTADLVPTAFTAPASASAGKLVYVSWTVQNRGSGQTIGSWMDRALISQTPTCCAGAVSLGNWTQSATIAPGATYSRTKGVTIPTLATGQYYLHLLANADGQLYESSSANNQRSAPITVNGTNVVPPPTTLAVGSVNRGVDPSAGSEFAVVIDAHDSSGVSRAVTSVTAVRLALKSGGGVLGGTLTGTIPAGASQVTISGVTYTKAESGIVLVASRTSGDALASGDSAPFSVTAGAIASYSVAAPPASAAGAIFGITVSARDRFANLVTTDSSTLVTLSSSSGRLLFDSNTDGVFGDATKRLTSGVLSASAKGTVAEATQIIATDAASNSGTAPVVISAGPAAALAFITQPGGTLVGQPVPGPPTVAVHDGFHNIVTASSASIIVVLGANPGGGALTGTTTRNAVAGIATFGDLVVNKPGSGYTLTASATGLSAASSGGFKVAPTTGMVSGRVTRTSDGGGIAAVAVDVLQAGAVKGMGTSGVGGTYTIDGLSAGTYDVRASAAGYATQTRTGVVVTAGSDATVDFALAAVAASTIRITSPASGSVIDHLTVLVRGELSAPAGVDVGVSVNGMPGFVEGSRFVALVPVEPATTDLTATASSFGGTLATDSIPITVQASATEPPLRLRATPGGGFAPLTVTFELSATTGVAQLRLDADGDGTIDYQGATLPKLPFTFSQPGVYPSQVHVTDRQGQLHWTATVVHVFDRAALDQRLQSVWRGIKDALRIGDVAGAASFIHSDRRDRYLAQWQQLSPATLANIDRIMTDIELVDVGFGGAQYQMLKQVDGRTFSYAVWFELDQDGLWRLRRF